MKVQSGLIGIDTHAWNEVNHVIDWATDNGSTCLVMSHYERCSMQIDTCAPIDITAKDTPTFVSKRSMDS